MLKVCHLTTSSEPGASPHPIKLKPGRASLLTVIILKDEVKRKEEPPVLLRRGALLLTFYLLLFSPALTLVKRGLVLSLPKVRLCPAVARVNALALEFCTVFKSM